jgi:hypothetical protein
MFSWGSRRKFLYVFFTGFFLFFILIIVGIFVFYERPNCFDGKKNGDEQGVDCGGSCVKVCMDTAQNLRINWVRVFKVKDGLYSVGAYVENPNVKYEIFNLPYKLKIYDIDGILIAEEDGSTFVPAGQAFGIFRGGIFLGDREPARATFEWAGAFNWSSVSKSDETISLKEVEKSFDVNGAPRISVSVENFGLKDVKNIKGFCVIFDNLGNAIASSETVLDFVPGGNSREMVFSWPSPLSSEIGRIEVLHWLLPSITF